MKFVIATIAALIAAVSAGGLSNEYLPPFQNSVQGSFASSGSSYYQPPAPAPAQAYQGASTGFISGGQAYQTQGVQQSYQVPQQQPAQVYQEPAPSHSLGADGYNYNNPAERRRKYRRYRF